MSIKSPKIKTNFMRRRLIYKEIGRAINDSKTENGDSAVKASLAAAKNTKAVITYFKKSKAAAKQLKKTTRSLRKNGLKNVSVKKTGKALRNTVKKASLEVLKNTGLSIKEGIRPEGTTDSTAGSVSFSTRSALEAKEIVTDINSMVKGGRKVYRYVNKNLLSQNKVVLNKVGTTATQTNAATLVRKQAKTQVMVQKKIVKRTVGKSISNKARKVRKSVHTAKITVRQSIKAATNMVKTVKVIFTKPQVLLVAVGVIAFLILFISISSAIGNYASLPANLVMADERTVNKYVDLITKYDQSMEQKIESYKTDPAYDDVVVEWMTEIGAINTNWQEILSIMAAENDQNLTFSIGEQKRVKELYENMNYIKTRTEIYYCSGCEDNGTYCPGHVRLYVQVYCLDMEDIIDDIGLEEWQKDWARNLAVSDWASLYPGINSNIKPQNEMSAAEIRDIILNTPESNVAREQIRETALSLVGKVGYFWGGKSPAGWNSRWGKSTKVTAPGSSSTGTYQPYGLDCSGFTDWVYKTAGVGNVLSGGSGYQWSRSYSISKSNLKVGDLVFKCIPGNSGVNHVGIYIGKDASGKNLYCHCAWSKGVTVDSYKGFKYYRRPFVNFEEV